MQTHYTKNQASLNQKFSTELESIIYYIVPTDYLISESILFDKIFDHTKKDLLNKKYLLKEIKDTLVNMSKKNQIIEVFGSKLVKAIL